MPQASEELRAQWPGGDAEAEQYLKSRGLVLRRDWVWENPEGIALNDRDHSALTYLVDEWDFGGLVEASNG